MLWLGLFASFHLVVLILLLAVSGKVPCFAACKASTPTTSSPCTAPISEVWILLPLNKGTIRTRHTNCFLLSVVLSHDLKLQRLSLFEPPVSLRMDFTLVNEHVLVILDVQETESFLGIEPLARTLVLLNVLRHLSVVLSGF